MHCGIYFGQNLASVFARISFKDVPGGFPKSDLLGVTVALIHVAEQRFWQYESTVSILGAIGLTVAK